MTYAKISIQVTPSDPQKGRIAIGGWDIEEGQWQDIKAVLDGYTVVDNLIETLKYVQDRIDFKDNPEVHAMISQALVGVQMPVAQPVKPWRKLWKRLTGYATPQ